MKNRNFSARMLRSKCKINAASRTVQNFLKLLGWRKIKKKTCAFVSIKNRTERFLLPDLLEH